ncbi:MAG: [LysW]-lysine hydrolase [Nanoarchaeota archaeon]|nr:[LysW]-lysine hydrolase [Nanoarchaeota archaeon]MBU1321260.1 [LysW]-lysine hydrolase [Nanoarchaeota archaeon]MBU1597331.1 [LysW]-lysine hydrolase [Nanoarchaeota archaeon]MBU2441454.1 [LysW]-lysine hydrolase [Nanoarchaeota archaeon]
MLVLDMVNIYSPTGSEGELVDFLVNWANKNGFKAYKDEVGNFIAEKGEQSEKNKKEILMVGHVDTVAGNIPVKVKDGKLYGRGSVDAKAPLACFLEAASKFDNDNCRLVVVGAIDEEGESKGARNILGKYSPDYIIVGEPSGWSNMNIGYKGSINLFYNAKQDKEHSSRSSMNCNERAVMFFNELRAYFEDFNQEKNLFNQLGIKLISINSNDDGFNESVEMKINIRIPVGFDIEQLKNFVEQKKDDAAVDYSRFEKPVKAGKDNKLVSGFIKAIREAGGEPKFKLRTGTSDMNILQDYDVPIVTYGPGDASLEHTPDECLDLEEYDKSVRIMSSVLQQLM